MARFFHGVRRKRRTREHVIADLSANHVERQALLCGFSVEPVHHDYGIDLYVQTYNRHGEIENGQIPIQVKASRRIGHIEDGNAIALRVHRTDLAYWLNEPGPVILVVYDASGDVAYWIDVQAYRLAHPEWKAAGRHERLTIRIPITNILDRQAMRRFAREKNDRLSGPGVRNHED